jgi:hypothetical protein|tara:strand:- start:7 stop:834 length:828 start_codon:yes stop_codon:yes gene_type:complete
MEKFLELAQSLYPNMPPDILQLFAEEWSKTGDPNVAISNVRRTTAYDTAFPGNKRPDGTVKFDEVTYQGLRESYIGTLAEFGVPRNTSVDLLDDRFTGLVEGEVSAREFAQRVGAVFQGVQENIPEVTEFYRENFGLELTPEAIFVGALDPTVGEEIVSGRITTAQIGGEAARAGFEISGEFAQRLQRAGISQAQARQLFTTAQTELPRLQELQARGGVEQPEEFTLEQFTQAAVFQSPEELEQIRLLEAEEASRFAPVGGLARRGRRVTGLVEE